MQCESLPISTSTEKEPKYGCLLWQIFQVNFCAKDMLCNKLDYSWNSNSCCFQLTSKLCCTDLNCISVSAVFFSGDSWCCLLLELDLKYFPSLSSRFQGLHCNTSFLSFFLKLCFQFQFSLKKAFSCILMLLVLVILKLLKLVFALPLWKVCSSSALCRLVVFRLNAADTLPFFFNSVFVLSSSPFTVSSCRVLLSLDSK